VAQIQGHPEFVRWRSDAPPDLRQPVLIAAFEGWNDAGNAATMAAGHVADRLDAETFADIDPEPFYDFTSSRPLVRLDDAQIRSLEWPANIFRSSRVASGERDLVVLLGLEPQLRWRTFADQIIAVAHSLGIERVITLGALLADVPHSRPIEVFGSTDDPELSGELELAPPTYEGPTGIVGILSAACRDAGLPTASFWSAVPSYVPAAPSPKAALALVDRVCEVLGTSVFVTDLEIAAAAYERQVSELVAEDEDTAEYVASLEEAWDGDDRDREILPVDPDTLVAEVERFLRDND
jgi:proteasome assembly chaperone (PAC2) family protein